MSKSIAAKKSAKKKKGAHQKIREKRNGYTPSRATQTAFPVKPTASVMAPPLRTVVYLTRIENQGWRRIENVGAGELPGEECPLVAHFSDGRTTQRSAFVYYERGEREAVFEAMADQSKATEEIVDMAASIIRRRKHAVAMVRRALQQRYGKPGQFHTCVLERSQDSAA